MPKMSATRFVFAMLFCALGFCVEAGPAKSREARSWDTNWDAPFIYECAHQPGVKGQARVISYIRSTHDNGKEDRLFDFQCRPSRFVSRDGCSWSGYLNWWDRPINYRCPGEGAIVAIASHHDNRREDRRYNVKCCPLKTGTNMQCSANPNSGYFNKWDGLFTLNAPQNGHINGIHSIHDNGKEDRLFRFDVCRPAS